MFKGVISFLKSHKIRALVTMFYGAVMLIYCYLNISDFTQSETIGMNITEEKQWDEIECGQVLQQNFVAEHKQLNRFFLQFQTENVAPDIKLQVRLKEGDNVLFEQIINFSEYLTDDQQLWFNSGLMLGEKQEYTVSLERVDESADNVRIRTGSMQENPGMALVLEYGYISKAKFFLCMFLLAAGCLLMLFPFRFDGRICSTIKVIYLIVMPFIMVEMFEWITNDNLLSGKWLFFNYIWLLVCYFAVILVVRKISAAVGISSVWAYLLACVNYQVLNIRERPILPWDIKAFSTLASVAGEVPIKFTIQMLMGMMILVILLSPMMSKEMFRGKKIGVRKHVLVTVIILIGIIVWSLVFYKTDLNTAMGFWTNMWNVREAYGEQGFFLSTFNNLRYYKAETPENYSEDETRSILSGFDTENDKDAADICPTNLIVIQSESFTDFSALGNLETNVDCLQYFHSMQENTKTGTLYVSSYGGGTCDTEWEILTGNSLVFLPPSIVPYQTYVNQETGSLAKILGERGYKTIAMHPNVKENWNRKSVFEDMQFDEFIDVEAYAGKEVVRSYYSDLANTEMIIQTYIENKGNPLFIFNISMQNHGGYLTEDFEKTVFLQGNTEAMEDAEEFLSLMKLTDESIKVLFEYFENVSEPTMIVIYGDHQPSLDYSFYEYLFGKKVEDLQGEEALDLYKTPIMIWTNYPSESKDLGGMSANYLNAVILNEAGIPMTAYQKFILSEFEKYPVLTTRGGMDHYGNYVDISTVRADLPQYEMIQYHILFGRTEKLRGYY